MMMMMITNNSRARKGGKESGQVNLKIYRQAGKKLVLCVIEL